MLVELGPNKRQNQISTSHTPAKYMHQLDRLRQGMAAVADGFAFKVVERAKSNAIKLGAFECSICIGGQKHVVASKLALGKWPAPSRVVARTMRYLGFGGPPRAVTAAAADVPAAQDPLRVFVLVLSAYDGSCVGADPGAALSLGVVNDDTREAFYPFAAGDDGGGPGSGGAEADGVGFYFLVDLEPSFPYIFTAHLPGWTQVSTAGPVFVDQGGPAVVRIFMAQEAPLTIRAVVSDGGGGKSPAPRVPLVLRGDMHLRYHEQALTYNVQTGVDGTVEAMVPAGVSFTLSYAPATTSGGAQFAPQTLDVDIPTTEQGDGEQQIVEICLR